MAIQVHMYVQVYIFSKQEYTYMCKHTHIYMCVYSCIVLLTNLQLSKEDTELQSVELFHYPVMKEKNLGLKSR